MSPDWTDLNLMLGLPGMKLSQAHSEMRKIRPIPTAGVRLPAVNTSKMSVT